MPETLAPDELAQWLRQRAKHSDGREQERLIMAAEVILRQNDMDAGRELMRQAWHEFNAIRARDGAPVGVSEEWWSQMTEQLGKLLGDDAKPWMTDAAKALLAPSHAEICDLQDRVIKAEAEAERLKAENKDFCEERDLAMSELEPLVEQNQMLQSRLSVIPIATGAPRCKLCGVLLDGELHKQFCSGCCAR